MDAQKSMCALDLDFVPSPLFNIFWYLKVFGLFKVVEGFGLLESSDNPNPQHTFLSVVHWQG